MRINTEIFSCSRKTCNRSATTMFRSSHARGFYHARLDLKGRSLVPEPMLTRQGLPNSTQKMSQEGGWQRPHGALHDERYVGFGWQIWVKCNGQSLPIALGTG